MAVHFPAALYLPQDCFDVASNQVIGRRIAGRLLTQAFAAGLQNNEMLTLFSPGQSAVAAVNQLVSPVMPAQAFVRVGGEPDPAVVSEIGSIHFPDPLLGRWAALRQGIDSTAFSITGVIHTVCSDTVLSGIGDIPLAPLYSWDAVVCTSTAGRAVVESALEQRLEAMLARFRFLSPPSLAIELPQLPVIPLAGPSEQPFEPALSREERRRLARQQLGLSPDAFVVAFVGRLSFHSKAHPISLYRALEELSSSNPHQQITLIECGHLFNHWIASAYDELRAQFPGIQFKLIGGLQPASELDKWKVLAAADVFTSPADNLQETFGLSLLEAMMAELPLVVTDWNGYRDLVEHGVNGFLVPTTDVLKENVSPYDELEHAYSEGTLTYDHMIGLRSLGVAVDHAAYVSAFRLLMNSVETRRDMAASGLHCLRSRFSPAAVNTAYRQLWAHLAERRVHASAVEDATQLQPLRPSYSRLFGHYATNVFPNLETQLFDFNCRPEDLNIFLCGLMNQEQMQNLTAGYLDSIAAHLREVGSLSFSVLRGIGLTEYQSRSTLAALCKLGLLEPVD